MLCINPLPILETVPAILQLHRAISLLKQGTKFHGHQWA